MDLISSGSWYPNPEPSVLTLRSVYSPNIGPDSQHLVWWIWLCRHQNLMPTQKTKQIVIYLNLWACQMRSIYLFQKLGLNGNIGKGVEEVGPYQSYWLTKMLSWTYRTTIIIPNKPKNSRAHASRLVVSIPETTHLLMLHHLPMWRWNVGQR